MKWIVRDEDVEEVDELIANENMGLMKAPVDGKDDTMYVEGAETYMYSNPEKFLPVPNMHYVFYLELYKKLTLLLELIGKGDDMNMEVYCKYLDMTNRYKQFGGVKGIIKEVL